MSMIQVCGRPLKPGEEKGTVFVSCLLSDFAMLNRPLAPGAGPLPCSECKQDVLFSAEALSRFQVTKNAIVLCVECAAKREPDPNPAGVAISKTIAKQIQALRAKAQKN